MSTVLFISDLPYSVSEAAARWIAHVAEELLENGHEVTFLPRERAADGFHGELRALGVSVLDYTADPDQEDASGITPRCQARTAISTVKRTRPDWILVQGVELSRFLAGNGTLSDRLWAILSDAPFRSDPVPTSMKKWLPGLATGCHRIVVVTESQRAWLESEHSELTSKVDLSLPIAPMPRGAESSASIETSTVPPGATRAVVIDLDYFRSTTLPDLTSYREAVQEQRSIPELLVAGGAGSPLADDRSWKAIPGTVRALRSSLVGALGILPTGQDPVATEWAIAGYRARGIVPVSLGSTSVDPRVITVARPEDLLELASVEEIETSSAAEESPVRRRLRSTPWFPAAGEAEPLYPGQSRPLRLVVAGADFKFAGDLITALAHHPWIDLRVDLFEHNARVQPEKSAAYLEWAEVVIAEFASKNALWYADNIRPDQRLIVHLHGYELLSDWIDDLRIENVHSVIVASEMYRDRALSMKEWPEDLLRVIGNSVSSSDLLREKTPDARFHLGLAGYVPILKRPDRALDLLRALREVDSRFTLHIRGHSPWNYAWEWKKSAHQDSYREFFRRAGEDRVLRDGISFEPFGPDMGNWLRRIGWLLSPSTRETFHLAGIEGATSGSIPLVWEREGSREIFSDRWNFASTEDIARFVLEHSSDQARWDLESARAIDYAGKYEASTITGEWINLVTEAHLDRGQAAVTVSSGPPLERELEVQVTSTLREDGYDAALQLLDANIPVTSASRGSLKDVELWVRGISTLDISRFALFPAGGVLGTGAATRPTTLRVAGEARADAARAGLELRTIDVAPPQFTDGPAPATTDIQPDRPDDVLRLPGRVRADRWISTASSRLAARLAADGSDLVVAEGPWWFALTAALAADRAGIRCVWFPSDTEDWARAGRAAASPFGGDVADHLALQAFLGVHGLVDAAALERHELAESVPLLDPGDVLSGVAPTVHWTALRPSYQGLRSSLERDPSSLRAVVIGRDDIADSLAAAGVEVIRAARTAEAQEALTAYVDLLVLDGSLSETAMWGKAMSATSTTAATPATRLFDSARAVGAKAVLTWPEDVDLDRTLTATARRADVIAAAGSGADRILQLNPISVQQITPLPASPTREDVCRMLRSIGFPVRVRASRHDLAAGDGPETGPLPDDHPTPAERPDISIASLETISVVIPTHRGRDRIGRALASIANQTLPASMLEVIVVENGEPDGTAEVVRSFARSSPARTVYRHLAAADASAARNLGISQASAPYVTFLDDDDEYETNHLLGLWASAGPDSIAVSWLHDIEQDGSRVEETSSSRRYRALPSGREPLEKHPEVLGQNACKLIPTAVAQSVRYPEGLASGEDVVFMAGLLHSGLSVVAAAPVADGAYLRHRRPDSLSRRPRDYTFSIVERLEVLRALEDIRPGLTSSNQHNSLTHVQSGQRNFIKNYLTENAADRGRARAEAERLGLLELPALEGVL